MNIKWPVLMSLPFTFLAGAFASMKPALMVSAIVAFILIIIARNRFSPPQSVSISFDNLRTDWVVLLLPVALTLRAFYFKPGVLAVGILLAVAYLRKPEGNFRVRLGPLALLFASALIAFSRPTSIDPLLFFFLVGVLVLRLITTVDARRIIRSLIDGCGLYLVANVVAHAAGLQSPAAGLRIGGLAETTGFVRTIYPLAWNLNTPPTIAAIYIAAVTILLFERGSLRRTGRLICCAAAIIVLIGAGNRVTMVAAIILPCLVIFFPSTSRWLAQAVTLVAAISSVVLPDIIRAIQFVVTPLMALTPGRVSTTESISSLQGREKIWDGSIQYWIERVNDLPHVLLGFGVNGQYRSGASFVYKDALASIVRNPQYATMHNSFLQQLFDGGIIGWLLLVLASFWASARLAHHRRSWGGFALSAILAMSALLLSGMTEVSLTPGPAQDTLWLLIVVVGVACQASTAKQDDTNLAHSIPTLRAPVTGAAFDSSSVQFLRQPSAVGRDFPSIERHGSTRAGMWTSAR